MTPEEGKGQNGSCPTVKIKAGDDYVVINEHDFNPDTHELYDAPAGDGTQGGDNGNEHEKGKKGKKGKKDDAPAGDGN